MTDDELQAIDDRAKRAKANRADLACIKANAEKLSTGELVVVVSFAADGGKYSQVRGGWSEGLLQHLSLQAREWFTKRARELDEEFSGI